MNKFEFTLTNYFQYRFRTGLLMDELKRALIKTKGDIGLLLQRKDKLLPIRNAILPKLEDVVNLDNRICIGGPGVLFAMARGDGFDDFVFPIQKRSNKVVDGNDLYAVIPKAIHQPMISNPNEVNIYWTVLREVFEELYGGEEVQSDSNKLAYNWYLDTIEPLRYFREHRNAFKLEVTGFGFNTFTGLYEFAVLFYIPDEHFYRNFKSHMEKTWESEEIEFFSTKWADGIKIADLVQSKEWTNESFFHLIKSLQRLKNLEPDRVELPDIIEDNS